MDEQRSVTLGEARTMLAIMHELEPDQITGAVVFSVVKNCDDSAGIHVHTMIVGLTDVEALHAVNVGIEAFLCPSVMTGPVFLQNR